jgi:pimeloyl-ACP methyl ester carboxylesterase
MTLRAISLVALTLTLLAGTIWTYVVFTRDLKASRERLMGVSKIAETARGPIEYAEAGEGPVILVVHGAGGGFDQGLELLEPLVARGFKLIAVSRFGYLRTPLPADASAVAQADAHASFLDALGVQSAAIFGVSAGGPSALQFAIRHPNRCTAVVLMVPIAYKPPDVGAFAPKVSPTAEKFLMTIVGSDFAYWLGLKFAPSMIFKTVMATPPEVAAAADGNEQKRLSRFMKHILPVSRRVRGIVNDSAISNAITRYELEKIAAPTLVLSARDDLYGTFASAQYTARQIPGAKFIGYDSGGHMLVGHYDETMSEIAAFLGSGAGASMKQHTQRSAPAAHRRLFVWSPPASASTANAPSN